MSLGYDNPEDKFSQRIEERIVFGEESPFSAENRKNIIAMRCVCSSHTKCSTHATDFPPQQLFFPAQRIFLPPHVKIRSPPH